MVDRCKIDKMIANRFMACAKLFVLILLANCISTAVLAQTSEAKVNILSGAFTIFNPSFEIGFGMASAVTMDYVGAYAEEDFLNTGYPFLLSMGLFGYRHYVVSDNHSGFFVGGDVGLDQFRMHKNIIPLVASNHSDDGYDVGHGYLIGVTLGYKYRISNHFNVEASLSGGWHHAKHESYDGSGVRDEELNPSGEWTPYKAGIYLSYVFGSR